VDASTSGDAEQDIAVLERELAAFSPEVASRPRLLVASKADAVSDPARLESIREAALRRGLPFFEISSATHKGLDALVSTFFRELQETAAKRESVSGLKSKV
jgi:GTP-binding protein